MLAARNNFLTVGGGGPSYELGISPPLLTLQGQQSFWDQETIDISLYKGATVRLVFYYQTTTSFTADLQLDDINIDGSLYRFENASEPAWETNTSNYITSGNVQGSYDAVSSQFVQVGLGVVAGRWNKDSGGTPSNSTGLTYDHTFGSTSGYYLYAETSVSPHPYGFWLRSPTHTLSNSPTLSFWNARYGATIGFCNVYLDVIS
jgi:hypothetical protein